MLTRAVGVQALVDVELREWPVLNEDLLLLCSDGLTTGVSDDTILRVVLESSDLQTVSHQLITVANDAGGSDNTTVVVVKVTQRASGLWGRLYGRLFSSSPMDPQ